MEETDTSDPYTYTYSSASAGTHRFQAIATDNDGLTTTSNTEPVEVNAKPTVSLSVSPAEITLGQMVTLTATATDSDGSVVRVSFIRGKVFQSYPNPASSTVTHTYTPAETGEFTFYAQAFDDDGAVTSSNSVTFNVIAAPLPNVPPTVSISVSDTAINEGESVTVTATAADSDGSVQSVEFRRNGNTVKTDTSSPYEYTYNSASAGTHIFEATAFDNDGDDTISTTKTVEVNAKPTVSLTVLPVEITLGQEVTLTATAADSDGTVTRVSFIRGKVFTSITEEPFEHTYTPAETGEFTFYAQAFDNDGAVATSNEVTFNVIAAPPPPPPPPNEPPIAMLSVTPTPTPAAGDAITLTGNYTDEDGNLSSATIYNLGTGDKTGNTGTFPSIDPAGESISGSSASISRSFTIPAATANGAYTFRTQVLDGAAAEGNAWKVITVGGSSPVITVSAPATADEGSSVSVNISASQSDWELQSAEIYHNGSKVETLSFTGLPLVYDYLNAALGTQRFYAVAVDENGNRVTSNTAEVTVTALTPTPVDTVSLSSSVSMITVGSEVTLTAEVSGASTVSRVEFYRDNSLINTDTTSPYSYMDTPSAAGTYSYFARAVFSDQSQSDSTAISVIVAAAEVVVYQDGVTWEDIDDDGDYDQVTTLSKPGDSTNPIGVTSDSVTINDIDLIITDESTYLLDLAYYDFDFAPLIPTFKDNDIVFLVSVRFDIEKGRTYIVQSQQFAPTDADDGTQMPGTPWFNWSPELPDTNLNRGYVLWCDFDNLWRSWRNIPEKFRVIQFGEASKVIGSSFSEDVNGDGVDDIVQEVSPEVYGKDSDELFIKVDCPDGVIGCDQDNTEFVIKDNGQWIIVDQNQNIARVISPGDTDYPSSGVTPNDGVVAVTESRYLGPPPLSFFFASVAPQQLLVPLNDLIAISKPLDGNVTVSVQSGASHVSHVKLWKDALKGTAYVSTESMPETLYVEGFKVSGTPWDVTLLFRSGSDSQTVKATVFDVTFGSSEIRKQDVNVDTTLPFDADKSAPLQWNFTGKKNLSLYLTAVSQLVKDDLQWKRNEVTITSSILNYRGRSSMAPEVGDILTYNVEVSHQQYSHLSDEFILVIYPEATATAYNDWVTMNQDSNQNPNLTWTEVLPRVYSTLDLEVDDDEMDPEPPALACANWKSPDELASDYHYHPGAAREMRTEALESGNTPGHQATYDNGGVLITSGLGAGTADRYAPFPVNIDLTLHRDNDVKPFIWAAQIDGNPVEGTILYKNLTHPLMHKGAKLIQYLELRPIRASNPIPMTNTCP